MIQSSAVSGGIEQSYEQYSNSLRNQYTKILETVQNENKILVLGLIIIAVLCFVFMLVMLSQKEKLKRSEDNFERAIEALKKQGMQMKNDAENQIYKSKAEKAKPVQIQRLIETAVNIKLYLKSGVRLYQECRGNVQRNSRKKYRKRLY